MDDFAISKFTRVDLCKRCWRDIDGSFRGFMQLIPDLGAAFEMYLIEQHGTTYMSQSECPLCEKIRDLSMNLFCTAKRPDKIVKRYVVRGRSTIQTSEARPESIPTYRVLIQTMDKTGAFSTSIDVQVVKAHHIRAPASKYVDLHAAKEWLRACQNQHEATCLRPDDEVLTGSSTFPLRLIDCVTRQLVENNNMTYATLSYVWGTREHVTPMFVAGNAPSPLPQMLPNTVEDAVTVTSGLGIRYLWIDRYCINQRDPNEVATQTSMMHHIYRSSIFTIIAACGEDPSHGLPGVSKQLELDPMYLPFMVDEYSYQPVWWDAKKVITSSKWATRGWTYQEQRFARRRIYFTAHGMFFTCDGKLATESGYPEWQTMETPEKCLDARPTPDSPTYATEICNHLRQYSRRELTWERDILNAFLGVIGTYETRIEPEKPIVFCRGIPLFPDEADIYSESMNRKDLWFLGPWDYNARFLCMLGWCSTPHHNPILRQRRKGFPSWSWTGWLFPFRNFWWEQNRDYFKVPPGSECRVETTTGEILTFDEVEKMDPSSRHTALSNFVHLRVLTTRISIETRYSSVYVLADAEGDRKMRFKLEPDTVEPLPRDGLILHLAETKDWPNLGLRILSALIVAKINGSWERIGHYGRHEGEKMRIVESRRAEMGWVEVGRDFGKSLKKEWRTIKLG